MASRLRFYFALYLVAGLFALQNVAAQQHVSHLDSLNSRIANSANDTGKFSLLLQAGKYLIDKPGSEPADISGALSYTQKALKLAESLSYTNGIGQSYTLFSQIYRERGDTTTGKAYISKSLQIFKNNPPPAAAAAAYFEAANYYTIYDNTALKQKVLLYQKGLDFFGQTNPPPIKLADALKFMGDLYQCNAEYIRSYNLLRRALALYAKAGYKDVQDVYTLLAGDFGEMNDMANSLRYNILAAKLVDEKKDSSMTACQVYFRLAIVYGTLHKFGDALPIFQKAKMIALKNKNERAQLTIDNEMIGTYAKMGQPAKALPILNSLGKYPDAADYAIDINTYAVRVYTDLHQFDKAKKCYNVLKAESPKFWLSNNIYEIAFINMLHYLLVTKQFSELGNELAVIEKMPDQHRRPWFRVQMETFAFKADSATGHYLEAIRHLNMAKDLAVTMAKNDFDKQIADQQVEYDFDKKDQQLAFTNSHIKLLTKENDLQKAALKDQRLIRNMFIASAALLAILLSLGYSRYRIKIKSNQQLQQQQDAINLQNSSLRQLVSEREWLLKEVHHRIKNNLQIVISLLNSQFYNLEDSAAKEVIRESQHRIHAVSLIHQKLYQYEDLAGIKMQEYIHELAVYLQDSFDTYSFIGFNLDIDPITLDVSQAVPLGLILNETITNSIKHAFKGLQHKGTITIALKAVGNKVHLTVSDNGIGLSNDLDPVKMKSLGIKLINGLTRQIKGNAQFINANGLAVHIIITRSRSVSEPVDPADLIKQDINVS